MKIVVTMLFGRFSGRLGPTGLDAGQDSTGPAADWIRRKKKKNNGWGKGQESSQEGRGARAGRAGRAGRARAGPERMRWSFLPGWMVWGRAAIGGAPGGPGNRDPMREQRTETDGLHQIGQLDLVCHLSGSTSQIGDSSRREEDRHKEERKEEK